MDVRIVSTGPANLASIKAALSRLGIVPEVASEAAQVHSARVVILCGVGTFGAASAVLQKNGVFEALKDRMKIGRPTLAIALGLQLLAEGSDESPGVAGLGILEGRATRFPDGARIPHMGWNTVAPVGKGLITSGHAYFSHSYRIRDVPRGWKVSWSSHGAPGTDGRFVAAIERGAQMATQFHPELSGRWGETLIDRWLRMTTGGTLSMEPDRESIDLGAILPRVIPCLDIADGRVVKGFRLQGLKDAGDPAELARNYDDRGADEIVMLDIRPNQAARDLQRKTIEAVRTATSIPVTFGGGIQSADDAARIIDAGADKVAVSTQAIVQPGILDAIANRFGRQCLVLGLDATRRTNGWEVVAGPRKERTGVDAVQWAADAVARGAGEILLTSMQEGGTRAPYDLDLVRAIRAKVDVPITASGSASAPDELVGAFEAGADAVLVAALADEPEMTMGGIKDAMERRGIVVRR